MSNFEIVSAANPKMREGDDRVITLDVQFSHLPESVSFAATMDDQEAHGRELYDRAMGGEFGEIVIVPKPKPTDAEQRLRITERLGKAALVIAPLEDAEKLGIITDSELTQLSAWRLYRVELYRLPQSAGWPTDVTWPEQPSG